MNREEYDKNRPRIQCNICGKFITKAAYNRHHDACLRNGGIKPKVIHKFENELICEFCGKQCKNLNSLAQHEVRCPLNPNRKDATKLTNYIKANRKGKDKNNCIDIQKQINTTKQKYANGYISPVRGRKVTFQYLYEEHNMDEIQKWIDYINTHQENIPTSLPKCKHNTEGYLWACGTGMYLHEYILSKLLGVDCRCYTIHHINKCRDDNSVNNLMIFATSKDHKRYHISKYAYISYDTETHLFTCEIKKDI